MGRESRRREAMARGSAAFGSVLRNHSRGPHPTDPTDGVNLFARTISEQPLGLARHEPDTNGDAGRCFENVWRRVRQSGGAPCFGWTFHYRISVEFGGYLFATHHAVWHSADGSLIDVTPFNPDSKHHPMTQDDCVLFLVDDAAQPVTTDAVIAPLPIRFFALGDDERLHEYVESLNQNEQRKCQEIYSRIR